MIELIMVIGIILVLIVSFRNVFQNTNKDYLYAENLIKDRFLSIKNNMNPQVNRGKHCSFCFFNKNNYKNSNLTYCDYFAKEIKKHGVDKTAEWHGNMKKLGKYLDGGGKKANDG